MSEGEAARARVTALVRGRVQGVGYRFFALNAARSRGLEGYARNLPDGRTVEVVAEGPRALLDEFVAVLWQGPRVARVDGVDLSWGPATGQFGPFDARA